MRIRSEPTEAMLGKLKVPGCSLCLQRFWWSRGLLHCTAVPVHTTLVYCSAVSAAIPLHFYTMILLYPLEYL